MDFVELTDPQKKELIRKAYDLGYEYEQKYGNCPQCTIAAIQDVFGIVDDIVFKASHGLAGGVGLSSKGTCGAVSGGVMVISALRGRDRPDFHSGRSRKCYDLSRHLSEKLESKYGGILCCQIQKTIMGKSFNLSNRDEFKAFEEAGGHRDKCPEVVGTVVSYIAEMIVAGEI